MWVLCFLEKWNEKKGFSLKDFNFTCINFPLFQKNILQIMFEQTFKNIDDILHKDAGCGSELDYVEQTSWILFLK